MQHSFVGNRPSKLPERIVALPNHMIFCLEVLTMHALSSKCVGRCYAPRPHLARKRLDVVNTAAVATKSVSGRMAELKAEGK